MSVRSTKHIYTATIAWRNDGGGFPEGRYSRAHEWRFDGGVSVPASASPSIVPAPMSRTDAVDPEEAFIAAVSSCHMLWFLDFARRKGLVVESYLDEAEGILELDETGRLAIVRVTLRPAVAFSGESPASATLRALHETAHEACFIANSVKTEIVVEPATEPA